MKEKGKSHQKSMRLWPGIVIVILQWFFWFIFPIIQAENIAVGALGSLFGGFLILIWWMFLSRAKKFDKWSGVAALIIIPAIVHQLTHESIYTGFQGLMFYMYAMPFISLTFVIWALLTKYLSQKQGFITLFVLLLLINSTWLLFRSSGITGNAGIELHWRWTKSAEEILIEQTQNKSEKQNSVAKINESLEWPGFRGPNRDGIVRGSTIDPNMVKSPPKEIWRNLIGPGCSSFAVNGDYFFTQEQLGEHEIVSCYELNTGNQIWQHKDSTRFWDSHAGAGPRSTPTLFQDKIFTLGGTGILNALEAKNGKVIWRRDVAKEINAELPGWGFTSSPLVIDSMVFIALSGVLISYDVNTGDFNWKSEDGGNGYSSPHSFTIDGIKQLLFMSKIGVRSFNPENGKVFWTYEWDEERILQPAITTNGDLLISAGGEKGFKRIAVIKNGKKWDIKEIWSTKKFRPSFNDIVLHEGFIYGFTGPVLYCVDAKNGEIQWKGGRYGGQMLLLKEQNLLLILTEKGEIAFVEANTERFHEISNFKAIEGKTWNHPVMVNNFLLVRNTKEMAAFQFKDK